MAFEVSHIRHELGHGLHELIWRAESFVIREQGECLVCEAISPRCVSNDAIESNNILTGFIAGPLAELAYEHRDLTADQFTRFILASINETGFDIFATRHGGLVHEVGSDRWLVEVFKPSTTVIKRALDTLAPTLLRLARVPDSELLDLVPRCPVIISRAQMDKLLDRSTASLGTNANTTCRLVC